MVPYWVIGLAGVAVLQTIAVVIMAFYVVRFAQRAWVLENLLTLVGRAMLKSGTDWSKTVEDPMAQRFLQKLSKMSSMPPPP